MNLYIDSSIVEAKKYITKLQIFLDDKPIIETYLQEADFSVIEIKGEGNYNLRLHFEAIKKNEFHYAFSESCSYDEFVSINSVTLPANVVEHIHTGHNIKALDNFICPISWVYAYDTVIENISLTEPFLMFVFSDDFVHEEIQVVDLILPKAKQNEVKLMKSISNSTLRTDFLKRRTGHWGLYVIVTVIWFPLTELYYWLYDICTKPFSNFYAVQNGIFTLLPYIAILFAFFCIFMVGLFWKSLYKVLKETNEVILTSQFRKKMRAENSSDVEADLGIK